MTTPHQVVNPETLPRPVGYAHAVVAAPGRTVYLGGQAALAADGSVLGEELVEQFDQALAYVVEALAACGGRPDHLVSMQVFVTDAAEYRACLEPLGRVWQDRVGRHYPAMTLLQVGSLLYPRLRVELLATAVIPD